MFSRDLKNRRREIFFSGKWEPWKSRFKNSKAKIKISIFRVLKWPTDPHKNSKILYFFVAATKMNNLWWKMYTKSGLYCKFFQFFYFQIVVWIIFIAEFLVSLLLLRFRSKIVLSIIFQPRHPRPSGLCRLIQVLWQNQNRSERLPSSWESQGEMTNSA